MLAPAASDASVTQLCCFSDYLAAMNDTISSLCRHGYCEKCQALIISVIIDI